MGGSWRRKNGGLGCYPPLIPVSTLLDALTGFFCDGDFWGEGNFILVWSGFLSAAFER
jgi:hypothetical protein